MRRLNQYLTLLANLGVIGGLFFLGLEVRSNTAANQIAVYESAAQNWMLLNGQEATNREFAGLLERASSGESLDPVEVRQVRAWIRQHLTGAFLRVRLYDQGLLTDSELRGGLAYVRFLARDPHLRPMFEAEVGGGGSRFGGLILEEDAFERWLEP